MASLLLALIYLAFISLGLPDAVLGSAWPIISNEISADISSMGIITIIIAFGTVVSSLNSSKLSARFSTHTIVTASILTTAVALFGFSIANSFLALCLFAIPYGLGAGSVDAVLNNYAAINLKSIHINWLHCMWGVGASMGPYIMGMALTNNLGYQTGYVWLVLIQTSLAVLILINKKVFSNQKSASFEDVETKELSLKQAFKIKGVFEVAIMFFCFSAVEQTTGIWASSYLVFAKGVSEEIAAGFGALFYFGIAVGRAFSGVLSMKFTDKQLIRAGSAIMLLAVSILFLNSNEIITYTALMLIGLGSAPIFPAIIHSTPYNFGADNSQSIVGIQMAAAYTGTLTMPALFGVIGRNISFNAYPVFILVFIILMFLMYEVMLKRVDKKI